MSDDHDVFGHLARRYSQQPQQEPDPVPVVPADSGADSPNRKARVWRSVRGFRFHRGLVLPVVLIGLTAWGAFTMLFT